MHADLFGTYPGGSVADTEHDLQVAAARAVVLADSDAAAFIDRSIWYASTPELRDAAQILSNRIAQHGRLGAATPIGPGRSGERSMPRRPMRLRAKAA